MFLFTGDQSDGAKRPSKGGYGRRDFRKFGYENGTFVHIEIPLLGGRLCEVAYTNPLIPLQFFFIFQPMERSLVPLAMPVTVHGATGAKARVSHGR